MKKTTAIKLLGGSIKAAAEACEITSSAISQWPEDLTKDQIDRVQAALYRQSKAGKPSKTKAAPEQAEAGQGA
jgi:translation initiation factor RLI1